MIPEQSETDSNRVAISAVQGAFNLIGTVIGFILPVLLQGSLDDPQNPHWETHSGQILTTWVPIIAIIFSIACIYLTLASYRSIDESFLNSKPLEKKSIKKVLTQMVQPLKHDNGAWFMAIIFGFNMAMRVLMTVLLPLLTYVVLLEGIMFIVFIFLLGPFVAYGFLYWNKKAKKVGSQETFAQSLLIIICILFLALILAVEMNAILKIVISVFLMGFALACIIGGFLFPMPILSSIVDEAANLYGKNDPDASSKLSGAYFGMNLFMVNLASAIANILLGFIFTGGREKSPLILTLALPIAGFIFLFTWVCLKRIKLRVNPSLKK
jgi:Na+/melibiose symporter-like transporter